MPVTPRVRLQLELSSDAGVEPGRWRAACRAVLGLDAAAAARLAARRPLTLQLELPGTLDLWSARLARDLGARVQPSRLPDARPCAAHPAALINERCPGCQQLAACALCRAATLDGRCAGCARSARRRRAFRNVRVAVLLAVLLAVALGTVATRRRLHAWRAPLRVEVVPVAADPDPSVRAWAAQLAPDAFEGVARFLVAQGARYGREVQVQVQTGPALDQLPPAPPPPEAPVYAIALWSLELRAWDWSRARDLRLPRTDARIYVVYHPARANEALDASLGLEQGHLGIVQAPVGEANQGWVELALTHELLHTLGATDKYDARGLPQFPQGLGDPDQRPTLPQTRCEVMAGRVAVDADKMPRARALSDCAVNRFTAQEIGWRAAAE